MVRDDDELHTEQHQAPTLYFDPVFGTQAAKILPGEYFVTQRDMLIVTVLGSCISVCLRDRISGYGGMNHFMLPGHDINNPLSSSARYGAYAMEMLINQLLKFGAQRRNLEAKVFGGGMVLKGFTTKTVGEYNAEFAMDYLQTEGIRVLAKDLLDVYPRKVYYFPKSGRVLVKLIKALHNDTIMQREREYEDRLSHSKIEGDVELF